MAGKENKNSEDKSKHCEDIQIDAHIDPDDNDVMSPSQVSVPDESVLSVQASCKQLSDASSNVQSTSSEENSTSSRESLRFTQTARPVTCTDEDEYLKHIEQMPDNLREENIDILIVHAESDKKAAAYFQNHLTKDIRFNVYNQPRHPRVRLLDEVRHGSMDHVDFAFNKSLYIFLFVTKDFCEEPWTLLQGQACLTEAIHDSNKKWCVVPIHTTSRKNRHYKLPMMLNSLRPINYWSGNEDQFYIEGVRRLLESKISHLLERERLLDEQRRKYFEENRTEILEKVKYKDKGMSVSTHNFSYQASASDYSLLNYHASDVAALSKPSAVHTGSSEDVYQTEVYRYSSFTNALDKALPDESLSVVEERMEAMAAAASVAVDQNNDLRVNIRRSPTDGSSQRSNREEAHQQSERSEMSQRRLQEASDRSQDRQSQETPQHASGRSHERQNQGMHQNVSGRSHERQNHNLLLQGLVRSHERLNEGLPHQAPARSRERLNEDLTQQAPARSRERLNEGLPQQAPARSCEMLNEDLTQQAPARSREMLNEDLTQQAPARSHERLNEDLTQQAPARISERLNEDLTQQAPGRNRERLNEHHPQQAPGKSPEQQNQGRSQQTSDRSHKRQNQGIPQHISPMNAEYSDLEHRSNINNSFTTDELNTVDIDGPDDDSSSVPVHENQAPHVYQHRSAPTTMASSLQYNNTSHANASGPHMMPSGITTPDHPTASPMLGQVHHPLPNYVNDQGSPFYMPRYFTPLPPDAFYPYCNSHLHPQMYPSFPSYYYPQVQPRTLQDLYSYANPIPPPSFFYQSDLRSHSQASLVIPSNESTQTSVECNTPDSVQSDLSHSSSTGALSAFAFLPGLSHHWPPFENLSESNVPFNPEPASDRHIPTSDPQINQPAEGAHANTAQQPQSRTPLPAQQRSFETSCSEMGQTAAAADAHSSTNSDRTLSAGPSSAATSVIQHIHHHHHRKTITVAQATNVLIGDRSQILNKNSAHVISDDESGGDDDAEDEAEASASTHGASDFSRFTENSSGSHKNGRGASGHVQSEKEDSKNVPMGFTEFLSPRSCRQPVERSEMECAETDDAQDQTNAKKLL